MADFSDAINWQRNSKPMVPLNASKDQEIARIYKQLIAQQQQQNQSRQGVYGVNSQPITLDQVRRTYEMTHPQAGQQPAQAPQQQTSTGQLVDRSRFSDELKDPSVRARLAALAYRETGGQGPQAQQAFIESVVNRAHARGKTISETISGQDGYFPRVSLQPVQPTRTAAIAPIIDRVAGGSNLSNGATGNASGTVGFNGGPQTFSANGERFGREGPDRNWSIPYKTAGGPDNGSDAFQRDRSMTIQAGSGAGWRDAPPMTGAFSAVAPSQGAGWRDTPPLQTAQMQTPESYGQNFKSPSAPAPQVSSWSQRKNAFQPQWNPDGSITWADGTKQQVSAFA